MSGPKHASGVTLIELMIVIAVLSITTTIAVSSYRGYLIRSNRTDARLSLLRIQAAQEKHFLQNNAYAADTTALGVPATSQNGYYDIDIDTAADGTTYVAKAIAKGGQTQDKTVCKTMTINQSGVRDPSNSSGCWK